MNMGEQRAVQKYSLYTLLKLKALNPAPVIGLEAEINQAETVMEQEDVAYVREKVEMFYTKKAAE